MKDNIFFRSTLILLIGGFITKILGLIIKIVMTRIVGLDGISLYMLIFPTFSLFMTFSSLGYTLSISKLISEDKYKSKKIIFSIIPISFIINLILMIIILLSAKYISYNLLNDKRSYYPILAIIFVIPFDSISGIIKGYYYGKQRMFPIVLSNIIEQIFKLILIVIITTRLIKYNIIYSVTSIVIISAISELCSIIIMIIFLPNKKLNKDDLLINKSYIKEILNISIPNTITRLIGSFSYFLEPIILTFIMKYTKINLIKEYGIIQSYVLNILMLPSFFSVAICSALIPIISKYYSKNKIKYTKFKINQAIIISLIIGIVYTFVLLFKSNLILELLYKTNIGSNYIKILSPIFILLYIQPVLISSLQSINKSNKVLNINIKNIIIKNIMLLLCVFIGIKGYLITIGINILFTTLDCYFALKKEL